jgi:hypothetical protein
MIDENSNASSSSAAPDPAVVVPARQVALLEYERYIAFTPDSELQKSLGFHDRLLPWWSSGDGSKMFPLLAVVAVAVLSVPPSSAVLERDFSAVSQALTRDRSSTDPAIIEMIMYLHTLRIEQIPVYVPEVAATAFEDESGKKLLPSYLFDRRFGCLNEGNEEEDKDIEDAQMMCDVYREELSDYE